MGTTVSVPSITIDESAESITLTAAAGNRPRGDENCGAIGANGWQYNFNKKVYKLFVYIYTISS